MAIDLAAVARDGARLPATAWSYQAMTLGLTTPSPTVSPRNAHASGLARRIGLASFRWCWLSRLRAGSAGVASPRLAPSSHILGPFVIGSPIGQPAISLLGLSWTEVNPDIDVLETRHSQRDVGTAR